MNILKYNERAAGMKRGGHIPSGPVRMEWQTGWHHATRRARPRPYGATASAFNAIHCLRVIAPRQISVICAAVLVFLLAVAPATARPPLILGFGDSLTAGLGLPAGQ